MVVSKDGSYKIQMLRGVAIITVVMIHSIPGGLAQVWSRPLFNFAVWLFLFLSGYLSDCSNWKPMKRIKKVIIPYMIWTLIYVLLENYKTPMKIPMEYLFNLLTSKSSIIMYYIFVYCQFTLLIPLIDKLGKSKYKYWGFVISPFEIIIFRLIPLIVGYEFGEFGEIILDISCFGWFIYYYLGYLLGNNLLNIKIDKFKLLIIYMGTIFLQILEGYWYYLMGESNCGTQLKLTAILSGVVFVILAYKFIISKNKIEIKFLYLLGNYSFGIYFCHLMIMSFLSYIPYYSKYIIYPINAIVVIFLSFIFVVIGRKIFGKYSKYLAL